MIAEEVAKVYPELVIRGQKGEIEGVRYEELTPMLLNELQKEHQHAEEQDETIRLLQEQNRRLEARLAALEALPSSKTPPAGQ